MIAMIELIEISQALPSFQVFDITTDEKGNFKLMDLTFTTEFGDKCLFPSPSQYSPPEILSNREVNSGTMTWILGEIFFVILFKKLEMFKSKENKHKILEKLQDEYQNIDDFFEVFEGAFLTYRAQRITLIEILRKNIFKKFIEKNENLLKIIPRFILSQIGIDHNKGKKQEGDDQKEVVEMKRKMRFNENDFFEIDDRDKSKSGCVRRINLDKLVSNRKGGNEKDERNFLNKFLDFFGCFSEF